MFSDVILHGIPEEIKILDVFNSPAETILSPADFELWNDLENHPTNGIWLYFCIYRTLAE